MVGEAREGNARTNAKVSIVGAGRVGGLTAFLLADKGLAGEVVLVDRDRARASGAAQDINTALPFECSVTVRTGTFHDCAGSDVIVIAAGAAQKAGESRLSVAQRNVCIIKEIAPCLESCLGEAVVLVVSNPVDVLTYAIAELDDVPWQRAVGMGTYLDTEVLRRELARGWGLQLDDIDAFILGEHGEHEVPAWSAARVGGRPLLEVLSERGDRVSGIELHHLFDRVKRTAFDTVEMRGFTSYPAAVAAVRLIRAILRDEGLVAPLSVLASGQYDLRHTALSFPVVLGRSGISKVLDLELSAEEQQSLHKAAGFLQGEMLRLNLF